MAGLSAAGFCTGRHCYGRWRDPGCCRRHHRLDLARATVQIGHLARWARSQEVSAAGLFSSAGMFLGRMDRRYLCHDGPAHVVAFAPTRSGRRVALVRPALLTWRRSAIIDDLKCENWQLTAGWRSRFSHCLLFNPTDPRSDRFNHLVEARKGSHEVRDVESVADYPGAAAPRVSRDRGSRLDPEPIHRVSPPMPDLKLPKLPKTDSMRLTIILPTDLHRRLELYARVYAEAYDD